jgi:hypothetical protein
MKRVLLCLLSLLAIVVAVIVVHHYVPLQPPVVCVYAGLGLLLVGLISTLKPLRVLRIRRRATALIVLLIGAAVMLGGLEWPVSSRSATGPHQRLDEFLPSYDFYERHEAYARAPVARVSDAVENVTVTDIPVAAWLMRIRGIASGRFESREVRPQSSAKSPSQPGKMFLSLDTSGTSELVRGFVGQPWANGPRARVATPAEFVAFNAPSNVKVAFNIAWSDAGGGRTRITTETRIVGTDDHARRTFARYWRVIYPGSAIIRRAWLNAIVAKAERGLGE